MLLSGPLPLRVKRHLGSQGALKSFGATGVYSYEMRKYPLQNLWDPASSVPSHCEIENVHNAVIRTWPPDRGRL